MKTKHLIWLAVIALAAWLAWRWWKKKTTPSVSGGSNGDPTAPILGGTDNQTMDDVTEAPVDTTRTAQTRTIRV